MFDHVIGPIDYAGTRLENNIGLAPMAGITSWPFRLLCQQHGAAWTVTELVSARGVRYDPELQRQYRYLALNPRERNVAIQLFSADPQDIDYAIKIILEHPILNHTAFIDLNMGCPVKKVIKTGSGAALLANPELAIALCKVAVKAAANYGKEVTVKIRSGIKERMRNLESFVQHIEATGISGLVVHPRLLVQMYSGTADWTVIHDLKKVVNIPVIGNGDLISTQSVIKMAQETGVDGFMIGRAARGNPWLFSDILGCLQYTGNKRSETVLVGGKERALRTTVLRQGKKISLWQDTIMRHLSGMIDLLGERQGVREMRKQLAFYTKGLPGATRFRTQLMEVNTVREVDKVLSELLGELV